MPRPATKRESQKGEETQEHKRHKRHKKEKTIFLLLVPLVFLCRPLALSGGKKICVKEAKATGLNLSNRLDRTSEALKKVRLEDVDSVGKLCKLHPDWSRLNGIPLTVDVRVFPFDESGFGSAGFGVGHHFENAPDAAKVRVEG